ncbi:hypothetical protein PGB28_09050 [Primorskyibacter aestuariivivens]|uniref:hypothetical protein n=1 Tax=Primorskyibacter aestuariivivens TaxID=1888912 RepID=UPI0023012CC4|nr:hypothetical protein [Primorskyibacter aestuariivivens]MDA7428606.1 hypothetical protein [Primorskyibacter aestuariivivens]
MATSDNDAQRHLACWTLQPIANLTAQEVSAKPGGTRTLDVMRRLQRRCPRMKHDESQMWIRFVNMAQSQ